jgi:hypothetical protein
LIFKIRAQAALFVVVQQRKLFIGVTISICENKSTATQNLGWRNTWEEAGSEII